MAKKPLEVGSVHRAKLWEIAFYALNNTSTNVYMLVVGSISYFLVGIVGIGAVPAGSIVTIMRIWDGVTDPFVGMLVDNTNTKFGKNRPFIVLGQILLFGTTFIMFRFIPVMPTGIRFVAFIIIYMIYIVGYTFQCVVTKSAQTCMTNDPEQRPVFSMFDSVYNILLMSVFWPVYLSGTMVPEFTLNMTEHADILNTLIAQSPNLANVMKDGVLTGFYNPMMWQKMQLTLGFIAAIFAVCGIIGISRKDNEKYFGLGKAAKISFKDYADVLAHNRGIQMLVLAASSDKLAYCACVKAHSLEQYSPLIQRVIDRIHLEAGRPLSLRYLADICNVNASYLSNLFRKETGMTLTEYINRHRIERSLPLLQYTQMRITEISETVGFLDENYFARTFKRIMGMSPKAFRKNDSTI